MRFTIFFKLLDDNRMLDEFSVLCILIVCITLMSAGLLLVLIKLSCKKLFGDKPTLRAKFFAFLNHIKNRVPMIIVTSFIGLIFYLLNFDEAMFPNLVTILITVLIIEFMDAEKTRIDNERITKFVNDELLTNLSAIIGLFERVLDLELENTTEINQEYVLMRLNAAYNARTSYIYIDKNGKYSELEVRRVDLFYYELPDIYVHFSSFVTLYNIHLSALEKKDIELIRSKLNKRVFRTLLSSNDEHTNEIILEKMAEFISQIYEVTWRFNNA